MGPIGCPETSAINRHYSLRNNLEEGSSHPLRGGSLKSHALRVSDGDGQWKWAYNIACVGQYWRGYCVRREYNMCRVVCSRPTLNTHTLSAKAFQTRRVTSKCNYPRTTIIDYCPDFSPVLASSRENTCFLNQIKLRTGCVCAWSRTRQSKWFTSLSKCKMYVTCNGWVCYHVQLWTAEIRLWGHRAELPLAGVENRKFPVTSVTRAGFQRKTNFKHIYLTANY